jgi:hypothetical protein
MTDQETLRMQEKVYVDADKWKSGKNKIKDKTKRRQ